MHAPSADDEIYERLVIGMHRHQPYRIVDVSSVSRKKNVALMCARRTALDTPPNCGAGHAMPAVAVRREASQSDARH